MEASELRFGNLVYDTKREINIIDLEAITYISVEPKNQVKPIPLTEKWLLKFGFKKKKNYYKKTNGISVNSWFLDNRFIIDIQKYNNDNEFGFCFKTNNNTTFIKSVHELQNIFYSLTFDELEYMNENKELTND